MKASEAQLKAYLDKLDSAIHDESTPSSKDLELMIKACLE